MKIRLHLLLLLVTLQFLSSVSTEPIFFTHQPEAQEVNTEEEIRLHCMVQPIPFDTKFKWFKSAELNRQGSLDFDEKWKEENNEGPVELIPNEEASVFYKASAEKADTGYYHCRVETGEYTIYSKTAFIQVKYFTLTGDTAEQTKQWYNNTLIEKLECNNPDSFPAKEVMWTKTSSTGADEAIDSANARLFVVPGIEPSRNSDHKRGSLLIFNVVMGKDDGLYKCWTKEDRADQRILLSQIRVEVEVSGKANDEYPDLEYQSQSNIKVVSDGSAVMVCAFSGYPLVTYKWVGKDTGQEVRSGDSIGIEDNGRRLVVSNIKDRMSYMCIATNIIDGRPQTRDESFYIMIKDEVSIDYAIEVIIEPIREISLKPNMYHPFELACGVKRTGQTTMIWAKNGEWFNENYRRIKQDENDKEVGDVDVSSNLLSFNIPNESDLGVYQCVIFNDKKLITLTTYVTLDTDSLPVGLDLRQPHYEVLPGTYSVDEAEEACNIKRPTMHLVSILTSQENGKVRSLMSEQNVASAWLGLTKEVPEPEGTWLWTSQDIATTYSNWEQDKPENTPGPYNEYAIIDASTGSWVDVDKKEVHSAICKRYDIMCPSIDTFYNGRVRTAGWEASNAKYEVGQTVEIFCRFPGEKTLAITHVTCQQNKEFSEADLEECPDVPSAAPRSRDFTNIFSIVIALLFLLTPK